MKKSTLIFCLFIFTIGFVKAEIKTEKRNTNPFNKISLRVAGNLFIEQGNEHSIEITASERVLEKIIVEVNDGKLVIRFSLEDRWISEFKPGPIDIHVVSNKVNMLSVQGSGNIYAEKLIESESLELNIAGSGDIKLSKVKADRIEADIKGSGDINIAGKSSANDLEINIAGSGDVLAGDFEAETAYVKIAGSGDCEIKVSNYLDVKIFGSGDILYSGDPTIKSQVSGSGKIRKK